MKVIEYGHKYIGYLEHKDPMLLEIPTANIGKGGYTIFAEIIRKVYSLRNFQGLPWCATFVHAIFLETFGKHKAKQLLGKPHPGTRVLAKRMIRKGYLRDKSYIPKAGDIMFMCNLPDNHISHVGIVENVSGNTITSIEGNTTDPTGHFEKSQGGAVVVRERQLDSPTIICYGELPVI